jgi:hypothetical protein
MSEAQIEYVASSVKEIVRSARKTKAATLATRSDDP